MRARSLRLAFLLVVLVGCAELVREKVTGPLSGTPEVLHLSLDGCGLPESPGSGSTDVRVSDSRTRRPLVGAMPHHALLLKLYEDPRAPFEPVLAEGVARLLAASPPRSDGARLEIGLREAWVESAPPGLFGLHGTIAGRFAFDARRVGSARADPAGSFRGSASRDVLYFRARDHEQVLDEALCDALKQFGAWLGSGE